MSWVAIIWSMTATASLTLAGMHVLIWWRQRHVPAHLLFALAATGAAGLAVCELLMMQSQTPAEFGLALKWLHLPAWLLVLSLVGFIRTYLQAGRQWLAWTVCSLRTISFALDMLFSPNLNYSEITGLKQVWVFGEPVSVAVGAANSWMLVGQLSLLLMVIFVADAAREVWRRGERRRAIMVGGSILFFAFMGTGQAVLFLWGIVPMPLASSVFFLGCVAAMSYELSDDVLHAAQLSRELKESESRFRNLADTAPVMIWISGPDKGCTYFNRQWLDFTGRSLEEELGDGWTASVHPEDAGPRVMGYREAFDARVPFNVEYRLRRHDGQYRWIMAHAVPCLTGDSFGYIGSCIDITDRKLAETERLRQRAELSHIARVSTMGQLASSLAHELNQPLGAILRNAEAGELLLKQSPLDAEEIESIFSDIRRDDERAGAVIDRMRSLLKRHDLTFEPLALNELLEQIMALVRPEMQARRVALQVQVPPDLPPVRGDRVHLQQVVLNLLVNGADAINGSAEDLRRIRLTARHHHDRTVEIAVSDTGHGIPQERLGRLFDQFFTTKSNGMGMGLAISRTIIESHGGRIWAENNPEGGATFRFTLKVADDTSVTSNQSSVTGEERL